MNVGGHLASQGAIVHPHQTKILEVELGFDDQVGIGAVDIADQRPASTPGEPGDGLELRDIQVGHVGVQLQPSAIVVVHQSVHRDIAGRRAKAGPLEMDPVLVDVKITLEMHERSDRQHPSARPGEIPAGVVNDEVGDVHAGRPGKGKPREQVPGDVARQVGAEVDPAVLKLDEVDDTRERDVLSRQLKVDGQLVLEIERALDVDGRLGGELQMEGVDLEPLRVSRELEAEGGRAVALGLEALEREIGRDRGRLGDRVASPGVRRQIASLEIEVALETRNLDPGDGRQIRDRPLELASQLGFGAAEPLDRPGSVQVQAVRREPERSEDRPVAWKIEIAGQRERSQVDGLGARPLDLAVKVLICMW